MLNQAMKKKGGKGKEWKKSYSHSTFFYCFFFPNARPKPDNYFDLESIVLFQYCSQVHHSASKWPLVLGPIQIINIHNL